MEALFRLFLKQANTKRKEIDRATEQKPEQYTHDS